MIRLYVRYVKLLIAKNAIQSEISAIPGDPRLLIADYLTLHGARVLHLIEAEMVREHVLNPHLRRESTGLVYDRGVSGSLFDT